MAPSGHSFATTALAVPSQQAMFFGTGVAPKQIFKGMILSTCGCLTKSRDEMRRLIERHGGRSVAKTSRQVALLITTPQDARDGTKVSVRNARRFGIPIVEEQYVADCIDRQMLLRTDGYEIPVNENCTASASAANSPISDDENGWDNSSDGLGWSVEENEHIITKCEVDHEPTRLHTHHSKVQRAPVNSTGDSSEDDIISDSTISHRSASAGETTPVNDLEGLAIDDPLLMAEPDATPSESKPHRIRRGSLPPKNIFPSPPPPPATPRKSARIIREDNSPGTDLPESLHKAGFLSPPKRRGRPPKRKPICQTSHERLSKRHRVENASSDFDDCADFNTSDDSSDDKELTKLQESCIKNLVCLLTRKGAASAHQRHEQQHDCVARTVRRRRHRHARLPMPNFSNNSSHDDTDTD